MRNITIGDLSRRGALVFGDGYRTRRAEHGQPGYRILRVADVLDGRVTTEGDDYVRREFGSAIGSKLSESGDVLLTTKGTVGRAAIYPNGAEQVVYSPQLCYFRVRDASVLEARFLYYWFKSADFMKQAAGRANNTDMAAYINLRDIASLEIDLPDISHQRSMVAVLGALDDKILTNDHIIRCLYELADAKLRQAAEAGSDYVCLGELATFHNRRRVPLSSRERETRVGIIPYYGAAGRLDYVDVALFNQPLVLVGEDGSVIRDDGTPVVQYIWGSSWVNNHAHVLTGNGISTETLRVAIRQANVTPLVTGAVQPKISMANLKKLQLRMPTQVALVDSELQTLASSERAVVAETSALAGVRDELLPLLMSGKVRVRDAQKLVEGVA